MKRKIRVKDLKITHKIKKNKKRRRKSYRKLIQNFSFFSFLLFLPFSFFYFFSILLFSFLFSFFSSSNFSSYFSSFFCLSIDPLTPPSLRTRQEHSLRVHVMCGNILQWNILQNYFYFSLVSTFLKRYRSLENYLKIKIKNMIRTNH